MVTFLFKNVQPEIGAVFVPCLISVLILHIIHIITIQYNYFIHKKRKVKLARLTVSN